MLCWPAGPSPGLFSRARRVNRTVATQLHGSGGDPCQGTVYGPVDGGPSDLGPGEAKERGQKPAPTWSMQMIK